MPSSLPACLWPPVLPPRGSCEDSWRTEISTCHSPAPDAQVNLHATQRKSPDSGYAGHHSLARLTRPLLAACTQPDLSNLGSWCAVPRSRTFFHHSPCEPHLKQGLHRPSGRPAHPWHRPPASSSWSRFCLVLIWLGRGPHGSRTLPVWTPGLAQSRCPMSM